MNVYIERFLKNTFTQITRKMRLLPQWRVRLQTVLASDTRTDTATKSTKRSVSSKKKHKCDHGGVLSRARLFHDTRTGLTHSINARVYKNVFCEKLSTYL